jgi:nicotinamidase-related amidase
LEIIDRSTVNAWHEPRVKAAIQATGRKKLIITGISTEVCLAFPAISATAEGYDAYAAIEASGAFTHEEMTECRYAFADQSGAPHRS